MDAEQIRKRLAKIKREIKAIEQELEQESFESESPSPAGAGESTSSAETAQSNGRSDLFKHPAIQTYRSVFHRYPRKGTYEWLIEHVGDRPETIELWREACGTWLRSGFNPDNVEGLVGMLEDTF